MEETAAAIEELFRERYTRFRNGVAPVTRASRRYSGRGSLEGWVWRIVLRTALEQRHPGEEVSLDAVDPEFVEPERDCLYPCKKPLDKGYGVKTCP